MDLLAGLLGGLGLFLIGIRALGQNLQSLAGPRMRRLATRLTHRAWYGGMVGFTLGGLSQSSNAVTFIAANMQASGLLTTARALPVLAWANLGTAALVLLTAVDLRLAALLLLGVAGAASYLRAVDAGRWRVGYGAIIGLGMLFLGLATLKSAAEPLRNLMVVQDMLALAGGAALPPLLLGAAITLVTQSSSAVTILAIALQDAGLLTFDQAVMALAGASVGSGLAVRAMGHGAVGSTRQLVLYQFGFKLLAAALLLLLFTIETAFGVPLLVALSKVISPTTDVRLGMLFAMMQLLPALVLTPLGGAVMRLLGRLSPTTAGEALGRPAFLYDQALSDPASALDLVDREQAGLLRRLPALLDAARGESPPGAPAPAVLSEGSARVEAALDSFLSSLLAQGLQGELLDRTLRLNGRTRLVRELRSAVADLAADAEAAAGAAPLPLLTEGLHLLLTQLAELADADDADMLLALTGERGDMMRRMRASGSDAPPALLHHATVAFERAVWLIRSLTAEATLR